MTAIQQKVWFITGTSTGFGREMAEQLLSSGEIVVATARKVEQIADLAAKYPETALALPLDVTDAVAVDFAVAAAISKFERVDVLVNNAGYGICGGIEETTEAEFMPVFETNVFGLIRLTRAFLPHFRKQRSGSIVNLSALAAEMAPLGVHVTIVEPGPFRTDFLGRSGVEAANSISDYDATVGKTREYFHDQSGKQLGDPVKAVKAIIAAVKSPEPPRHLLLGSVAFNRMTARLELWQQDMAAGRETAFGADYDSVPAEAK